MVYSLGGKVNDVCTRKVGDPAEVHTHYIYFLQISHQ